VSPILVRPVREQFEHDRVIRVLQARYRRKYEVAINPGSEQNAGVPVGDNQMYPDLVLFSQERGRKIQGTIEVETGESVNTLEAMAEWGPFSRLRAPFVLYVPTNSIDTARRLCTEHQVAVAEIWTYHTAADQVRFTMVHRAPEAAARLERPEKAEKAERAEKPAKPDKAERVARPEKSEKPERPDKPEKKPAAVKAAGKTDAAKARTAKTAKKAAAARKPPRAAAARTGRGAKASRKSAAVKKARPTTRPAKRR
jgi:hypothetical protein